MKFTDFDLQPSLLDSLAKANYVEPTSIQSEVIPTALAGKNVVGQSQTGTGKTGAFLIPLLNSIDTSIRASQALILGPTRELVSQIREDAFNLSRSMSVRSTAVYGGAALFGQKKDLDRKPHIIVGTPGRTMDFIDRGILNLASIEYLILDEVDRMLDMGFVEDIEFIWENCKNLKQVFAFSATITPEIRNIIENHLGVDYTFVKSGDSITVDKIDHSFMDVPHIEKYEVLKSYLETHRNADEKVIVFTETKRNTEQLVDRLEEDGFEAGYINGDMKQSQRFRMMDRYKKGLLQILVTTDVAARGLNLGHIHLVINYDVPNDPESYIHRIGRTGRAGKEGKAIMFVSRGEGEALRKVEKSNKIRIKKVDSEGVEISRDNETNDRRGSSSEGGRGGRSGGRGFGGRSSGGRSGFGGRSGGRGYRDEMGRDAYGDRKPRQEFSDRSERAPRKEFADRKPSFGGDRTERKSFERSSSQFTGERREWTPRKPREDFSDRKPSFGGERPERKTFGSSRNSDSSSRPTRSFDDRPRREERAPSRPARGSFFSDIDSFAKPSFDSDRPVRKATFGDRKPSFGGDRPERKTFGEKREGGENREWTPRAPRKDFGNKKSFGEKRFSERKPFKKKED